MTARACLAAAAFVALTGRSTVASAQDYRFHASPYFDTHATHWLAAPPVAGTTVDLGAAPVARHTRAMRGAQEACDQTRARAQFDQGVAAADRLEWPDAATAFQRSYEMCHEPRALRNLGLAHRALGRYTLAIRELSQFLAEGSPEADVRALVEQAVVEMRGNLATLTVEPSVDNATVLLDGVQVEPHSPQAVDPGNHLVLVTAQGYQRNGQSVTLTQHESRSLPVRLDHAGGVGAGVIVIAVVGALAVAGGVIAAVLLLSHEAPPDCGSLNVCLTPQPATSAP